MAAAAGDAGGHLSCTICFLAFDGQQRRPWDIGCGHSFCEQCLSQHPRSFRYCPECRTRASNPHVNISLLRLVDVQGPAGAAASREQRSQQQQQQLAQQLAPGARLGGEPAHISSSNVIAALASVAAAATATTPNYPIPSQPLQSMPTGDQSASPSNAALQTVRPNDLQNTLAAHQATIAELRTKMWVYLTPLLGFLYLISPLDIIPDFLPLIGWLDDLLVIIYIAYSLMSLLGKHNQPQQRNTMRL